jgi:hypothetical protein
LNWVLWYDPRCVEKNCWSRHIQAAIHSMDAERAFPWQWLFRNAAPGLNAAPGKTWVKEGQKRLSRIGEAEFIGRLDEWCRFPHEMIRLCPAGSSVLRLLVWYGSLVDINRSLPILVRLASVAWAKREPAQKAISALAWLLRINTSHAYRLEIERICQEWSADSSEVKRLEEVWFPDRAAVRKQAEQAAAEDRKKRLDAQLGNLKDMVSQLSTRGRSLRLGDRSEEVTREPEPLPSEVAGGPDD